MTKIAGDDNKDYEKLSTHFDDSLDAVCGKWKCCILRNFQTNRQIVQPNLTPLLLSDPLTILKTGSGRGFT